MIGARFFSSPVRSGDRQCNAGVTLVPALKRARKKSRQGLTRIETDWRNASANIPAAVAPFAGN